MESVQANSRKRTNLADISQTGGVRPCHGNDEYPPGYLQSGQKRLRAESSPRGHTSHSNALSLSPTSSFVLPDNTFSNIRTQQDSDSNLFHDGLSSMFYSAPSLVFQQYPFVEGSFSPHQDVAITNTAAGTPATYTITNGTISPGSLKRPSLTDLYDYVNQSPEGGSDLYAGSEDFNFGLGLSSHFQFDNFDVPNMSEQLIGMDNGPHSQFLKEISDMQEGNEQHQLVQPIIGGLDLDSEILQSLTTGTTDSPYIGLQQQQPTLAKALPPVTTHTPPFINIQPSKEHPNTSPNSIFRHIAYESLSPHLSPSEKPEIKPRRKQGCRDGSLDQKIAKHAREMRVRGSCWPCRISKVTCLGGDPCDRCSKVLSKPSLSPRICLRIRIRDYGKKFIPDVVDKRFSKDAISKYIEMNAVFTSNTFEIEISSGPSYPKIHLWVNEFRPLNEEALALNVVAPKDDGDENSYKFVPSYAPPLGLDAKSVKSLRDLCLEHIKAIIEKARNIGEADQGDVSIVSWKIFEAVNRYRRSIGANGNSRLLEEAAMLHAMQYFMSRIITLNRESAEKAIESLRRPHSLKFAQTLSSTLLNLQVKQAMQRLLSETVQSVLEDLDKALSKCRGRASSWADIFCVVLVLCMCIEAVQVASDAHAMAALRKDPSVDMPRARICHELDEKLFKDITGLFHMVYKSGRAKPKGTVGFNPIRNGIMVNEEEGITPQMVKLVNEIKHIMAKHGHEMARIAENPEFDPTPDVLTHHMVFRKRNSGRLVSKFLRALM